MHNWFESKVRYDKTMDTGMVKSVTEAYLIDAMSFTEAEARTIEEMRPLITGEFSIADISRKKYSEAFFNETGDRYFRVKVNYITLDEKSGTERKAPVFMLVQATTIAEAQEIVEKEMKETMIDYTIEQLTETKIMDVFLYGAEKSVEELQKAENDREIEYQNNVQKSAAILNDALKKNNITMTVK